MSFPVQIETPNIQISAFWRDLKASFLFCESNHLRGSSVSPVLPFYQLAKLGSLGSSGPLFHEKKKPWETYRSIQEALRGNFCHLLRVFEQISFQDLMLATLSSLALLYDAQNQFSRAEETLKEEVKLRTERSGQHSRDRLLALCHLARVYKGLGKYRDAAKLLEEVINIQGKACYVDHLDPKLSKDLYASLPRECRE